MFDCTRNQGIELKDDTHGVVSSLKSCSFCGASQERGFAVVFENDELVVFRDRSPAAQHHLLVITRSHVESVKTLTKADIPMCDEQRHVILSCCCAQTNPPLRFGFHIPPFNSVDHIHLHVQGLPYLNTYREKKYRISRSSRTGKVKGFGWFVEFDQCVSILESGKRVGVFPC
ncbi:HIT-like protein [Ceratobasidium sp. AG-I]|nr:HIT-like protein [Ceratobasidium sp. AG-I]